MGRAGSRTAVRIRDLDIFPMAWMLLSIVSMSLPVIRHLFGICCLSSVLACTSTPSVELGSVQIGSYTFDVAREGDAPGPGVSTRFVIKPTAGGNPTSLGKIEAHASVAEACLDYGFLPLAISLGHAEAVRVLPHHHRDPFDRILVAQARFEKLALVTKDPLIGRYDVALVWD
jgi:hypothetical protein